jgi:serine/threonine-protein kinase
VSDVGLAFKQDGGEVIFSLPNQLQGYFLVDGKGGQIHEGPVDVVFDRTAVTGVPLVLNGVSCMICHQRGLNKLPADEVRDSNVLGTPVQDHIRALYPPRSELEERFREDQARFEQAVAKVIDPFVSPLGHTSELGLQEEPIGFVVARFRNGLRAEEIALELGLSSSAQLREHVGKTDQKRSGIDLVLSSKSDATIKRDRWETNSFPQLLPKAHEGVVRYNRGPPSR